MSRLVVSVVLVILTACGPRPPGPGPDSESAPPSAAPVVEGRGRATSAPPPEAPAGDEAPASMKAILEAHNQVRARHCAAPLAWSKKLAKVAQAWADSLARRGCAFDHSGGAYGENLAGGTSGTLDAAGVVDMWYRERKGYDFRGGGFSMNTGHFTQLVWRGTTHLGCGTVSCKGLDLWVCNYDPPGNFVGERPY